MPKQKHYERKNKLTREEIKKKVKSSDESDAYLFDVEYEKLKQEREKLEREYEKQREEYMRITEQLRQEMTNGTASQSDVMRFMSALTDKGVQLQQQQQRMSASLDKLSEQQNDINEQMNELRRKAFSGATTAQVTPRSTTTYNGFKTQIPTTQRYANAKVVEMSPQDYLRNMLVRTNGGTLDELTSLTSPSNVERYMRQMLRGTKYNAPTLGRSVSSADRDRAIAAIMNGYKRIPVLVIE